jgi:hypothetical protein
MKKIRHDGEACRNRDAYMPCLYRNFIFFLPVFGYLLHPASNIGCHPQARTSARDKPQQWQDEQPHHLRQGNIGDR